MLICNFSHSFRIKKNIKNEIIFFCFNCEAPLGSGSQKYMLSLRAWVYYRKKIEAVQKSFHWKIFFSKFQNFFYFFVIARIDSQVFLELLLYIVQYIFKRLKLIQPFSRKLNFLIFQNLLITFVKKIFWSWHLL